jgi:glucokinase
MESSPEPFSIGIDLGGSNIKLGLVSMAGKIVARARMPTRPEAGPKRTVRRIVRAVRHLTSSCQPVAIGVGVAGLIEHHLGIIRIPPNLPGWDGTPLKEMMEKATGITTCVGNDVNAVALGELLFGAGQGRQDVFCMTLGTGVGGGIISNGRLVLGANHAAGEVGHTVIFPDGQMCRCGNRGCLECYVGAEYIVQRTVARLHTQGSKVKSRSLIRKYAANKPDAITPKVISRAAARGDPLALDIIEEVGYYIGLGIINVVHLLDPELVVIGGGMSGFGKPLLTAINRTVDERLMKFPGRKLEICLTRLGDDAGVLGASQLDKFI